MRINGIQNVNQVYNTKKANKGYGSTNVAGGKDSAQFSAIAKELSIAKQAVDQTPDVRQARIDEIKQQMEAGTYNISAAQVADKIISQI